MEPFGIENVPEARRHLSRLGEKHLFAVLEFIYGALAKNPHRVGHPLHRELEGRFAARRGGFRVVYAIDDERRMVKVYSVEHRSDVYRRR